MWWLIRRGRTGAGHAGGLLDVWMWWEWIERRRHGIHKLRPGSMFDISIQPYSGRPLPLGDARFLKRGARIVELHLDNPRVSRAARDADWNPWRTVQDARGERAPLPRLIRSGHHGRIDGVHAVSLYAPALRRLGFRSRPLRDSIHTRLTRFFFVGLLAIYHPLGWAGAQVAMQRGWPSEAWIGAAEFERIYSPPHTAPRGDDVLDGPR